MKLFSIFFWVDTTSGHPVCLLSTDGHKWQSNLLSVYYDISPFYEAPQ